MQKGLNDFTILVTNISGSPITGITSGSFYMFGNIGANDISTFQTSITEETSGFYTVTANLNQTGQGYFGVKTLDSSLFVTPDYFDVVLENYDFDSLYSLFLTLQQTGLAETVNNYVEVTTNPYKENDDLTIDYAVSTSVTPNLSGWTNFKAELRTEASLTTAVTSGTFIGLCPVTVLDEMTNSVSVAISGGLTLNTVPEGENSVNLYMDLQGLDSNGKKKTLIEFTIPIVRQITYN